VHLPVSSNHRFAHACVLCGSAAANLRSYASKLVSDLRDDRLIATHNHAIPELELSTSLSHNAVIHTHLPSLDQHLGLTTGANPSLPFQELIESHQPKRSRKSIDSVTRC